MTISYQRDVASSTAGGFTRLLFKWKGSIYKLIYRELMLFLMTYMIISLTYRKLMTISQRGLFEMVVKYFDAFLTQVPLSFVLGFYVSYVANRWWQQFLAIPWPDKLFHSVACFVGGFDEESRILRRSLMRYMNLAFILVLRSISSAVKQRFPTLEHVVEAGFMTNQEKELFNAVPATEFNTYWIPCTWFIYRIQEAAKNKKLINDYALETIIREFSEFRAKCGLLWCYDWVSIPMVYTQVVTLATYVFFIFTVIGRQKIDNLRADSAGDRFMRSGRFPMDLDLYIPIFTILQFFFYMGLLKVAEQLINPFGDDDEDFELNWLVDRHMKASFLGCDILMDPDRIPPMVKDYYWDKQNCPIPYTEASMHFKRKTYKGSADEIIIPENKQHMVLPEIQEEDEDPYGQSRLSLTSLLLESTLNFGITGTGTGTGADFSVEREPGRHRRNSLPDVRGYGVEESNPHFTPGSWRNGGGGGGVGGALLDVGVGGNVERHPGNHVPNVMYSAGGGSGGGAAKSTLQMPDQPILRRLSDYGGSVDSMDTNGEDDSDRRGSVTGSSVGKDGRDGGPRGGVGSRLSDLMEKGKGGKKVKRKKDKQGFVWRRMIHDQEDFSQSRTPRLAPTPAPSSTALRHSPESLPYRRPGPASRSPQAMMTSSAGTSPRRPMDRNMEPSLSMEEDRASVNSFKTCPSETNLSYLPRQVSDTYATSGGAATLPGRNESSTSRKESAASRRRDSAASGERDSAAGAKNSHSSLSPKTSILRSNAYAAEPRLISPRTPTPSGLPPSEGPPRSPSGVPLPQLVERPPSQNEFSYGSLMQQGPGAPTGPGPPPMAAVVRRPSPSGAPAKHIRFPETQ